MRAYLIALVAFAAVVTSANASQVSIGHNGINSAGLLGVSILAPGEDVDMVRFNGASTPNIENDGTSFAAPHVTGTVALLQQYAEQKIAASTPRWDADARRHEVMKAVLLNLADKILDNGTAMVNGQPVPQGYLLGMERTVLDYGPNHDGINPQDWLQSEAYGDDPFSDASFREDRGHSHTFA